MSSLESLGINGYVIVYGIAVFTFFRNDFPVLLHFLQGTECTELSGIFQLSAADTTEIHAVTETLREKNKGLEALNLRLRKYGENVDELTRAKERLETKSRIHSELGQALLASRRYLVGGSEEEELPLEQWRGSIAMLRKEAQQRNSEKPPSTC